MATQASYFSFLAFAQENLRSDQYEAAKKYKKYILDISYISYIHAHTAKFFNLPTYQHTNLYYPILKHYVVALRDKIEVDLNFVNQNVALCTAAFYYFLTEPEE